MIFYDTATLEVLIINWGAVWNKHIHQVRQNYEQNYRISFRLQFGQQLIKERLLEPTIMISRVQRDGRTIPIIPVMHLSFGPTRSGRTQ